MKATQLVIIRTATETDILPICRLQQEWFAEDSTYGFEAETPEQVRSALGPFCLVAEIDGTVVGFISGSIHISEGLTVIPTGEDYLEVDNLYVAAAYRQQGIGGRLMDALLAEAKNQQLPYALLYSATKDIHSVLRFYEQHGYQSWFVQMFQALQ